MKGFNFTNNWMGKGRSEESEKPIFGLKNYLHEARSIMSSTLCILCIEYFPSFPPSTSWGQSNILLILASPVLSTVLSTYFALINVEKIIFFERKIRVIWHMSKDGSRLRLLKVKRATETKALGMVSENNRRRWRLSESSASSPAVTREHSSPLKSSRGWRGRATSRETQSTEHRLGANLSTGPSLTAREMAFCVCSVLAQPFSCVRAFATPWTLPARLFCPWNSPGKNTVAGCHFLLQRIFLSQGWNPHLLRLLDYRLVLYH